jgi:hypothetical protein
LPVKALSKIPNVIGSTPDLQKYLFERGALEKSGKNYIHETVPQIGKEKHLRLCRDHFGQNSDAE